MAPRPNGPDRFIRHSREAVTSRLRLRGYDYSLPGDYFVTICVEKQTCLFGDVEDDRMIPSLAGTMVECWWNDIPRRFPGVLLDEMILMPSHLHGIVELTASEDEDAHAVSHDLSDVIRWFKTMTTNDYIRGVRTDGWPRFPGTLWQEGFHEHIVRNEQALQRIRAYIGANPSQWHRDEENPHRIA